MNFLSTEGSIDPLRWGWVAVGLLTTVLALTQKYLDGLYRIRGPLDHSNGVPLYSNLVIPVLLLWGLPDRRLSRREAAVTILASLGLVFAVVATQSRAGTVLSGACVLGALGVANLRASSRRVSATTGFVLACVVVGGAMAADTIVRRFKEAPESSEEARHEFNEAAKLMAADRRFGVGLNSFSRVLTDDPRYNQFIEVMKDEEQAGVAHHIYWLSAAETGYPGLVVFLVVIGRLAWLADGEFILTAAPVLKAHGYTQWQHHPFTDVMALRHRFPFSSLNLSCGYRNWHRPDEYVVVEDVAAAIRAGEALVTALCCRSHPFDTGVDDLAAPLLAVVP